MIENLPSINEKGRYSIEQTASILGIHRDTLYKYTHVTCEIRCRYRKVGGLKKKYYLGIDILDYWNNQFDNLD